MADKFLTKAAEVLADHAYKGGYDLNEVYGKKKPSDTSSSGGAYVSAEENSSAGPYGGPQFAAPYARPAAKPATTTEDYSDSQPPVAPSGQGRYENYGESRPSGYVEEGQNASRPGYERWPDSRPPAAASGYGKYDNYGESRPSEYVEEGQYSSRPGYERWPDSRPPVASSGYGKYDNYGESRPPGYVEGQYSSQPGYERWPDSRPSAATSVHGNYDNYGESRPPGYLEGQYSSRPGYGGEYEIPEGRFGGVPDQPIQEVYPPPPIPGVYPPISGYGGRRPAPPYNENELPSRPYARPQSQHWGLPTQESEYSDGRIPEPRRPGWQQDPADSSYGGQGVGGRTPPYGRPESDFTGYEAPRPTYGGQQGAGGYGLPFKNENPLQQEEFGRPNDGDWLASETAGLSLGSSRYVGRYTGSRQKTDDSDGDDEKKNHNRHHEKHHQKHADDYY